MNKIACNSKQIKHQMRVEDMELTETKKQPIGTKVCVAPPQIMPPPPYTTIEH